MKMSLVAFNRFSQTNLSMKTIRNAETLSRSEFQSPHFSGEKLFGTEDKHGKKQWSINLTGLPLIDRALAYVTIPFVCAVGLLPVHSLTSGGKNLERLTIAYQEVAQADNQTMLSSELIASMQQEKFRGFITEFNHQVAKQGKVDASQVLGQFPVFSAEDIQVTQKIINEIPEGGAVDDIRNSIQQFKTEVLSKHFTEAQIASFDKVATNHLDNLKVHENIDSAATLAAIIAISLGVGIVGLGVISVFGALNKAR
jgi:hypothetical protein